MATQAYRDKRIAATEAAKAAAEKRWAKAIEAVATASAEINAADNLLAWLKSMPVDDAPAASATLRASTDDDDARTSTIPTAEGTIVGTTKYPVRVSEKDGA